MELGLFSFKIQNTNKNTTRIQKIKITHINDVLYNEIEVVKELFYNL